MTDFKDKAKGLKDQVAGEAKEAFGKVTNNAEKEAEGKAQKLKGAVEKKVGDLKK
ncbi:CsbD family protein [Carnobacterium gallinarum]|uniref:CsbD family protein n=1 Tax=Carnobacterium gallinarum TaxID=2749 RepID=UPI00054DC33E|nr:CsbD family protein [Carnobacterium gallinarum]